MSNNEVNHKKFMQAALKEAEKALMCDEVPIGAVIVKDNKVIARGFNVREQNNDPTGHAEIVAIRKAAKKLKSWRLPGCRIYVTLEPCAMCAGAILWARLDEVVFAAFDPKGGALCTCFNLYDQPGLNHRPKVIAGIEAEQAAKLLSDFFKDKRTKTSE
ncbi:MAG: tRNA adenosine(34) deaminase TadA [Bacilli bacterium]|jgi:tRNA(adenine34) deaminase